MTTKTHTLAKSESALVPVMGLILLGVAILFTAGFAQAEMLHDSAHDVRHSIGFACH